MFYIKAPFWLFFFSLPCNFTGCPVLRRITAGDVEPNGYQNTCDQFTDRCLYYWDPWLHGGSGCPARRNHPIPVYSKHSKCLDHRIIFNLGAFSTLPDTKGFEGPKKNNQTLPINRKIPFSFVRRWPYMSSGPICPTGQSDGEEKFFNWLWLPKA